MILIAFFMGIVLIERNIDWTSENTYVYLQKKPKQNDSESKWKQQLINLESHHSLLGQFSLVH